MRTAGGSTGGSTGGGGLLPGAAERAEHWERSVRFWMRAYPQRWRVVRGEELVGVLADLAAPGASGVGVREAVSLVRGGWATRWREHPPVGPWIRYRFAGRRLREPWLAWVRDDIEGALYGVRTYVSLFAWMGPVAFALGLLQGPALQVFGILAAFTAANGIFMSYRQRSRALLKHVAPRPGDRLYDGRLTVQDGPRVRTDARSGLGWLAVVSGLLLAGSLAAIVLAPLGWWVEADRPTEGAGLGVEQGFGPIVDRRPALAVVLAGTLLAVLAVRRVRRRLPEPVDQPDRLLRPVGVLGAARSLAVVALGALGIGLEIAGRLVMLVSPVLALGALVLVAASLAGLAELRRAGAPEVAVIDVLHAVLLNRPPEVDAPVPWVGRVPDGGTAPGGPALGGSFLPALPV